MDRLKFMHCLVMTTSCFIGIARGATPSDFATDLFTELTQKNFQVEGTDNNAKPFNNFTQAKKDDVNKFFNDLIENLVNKEEFLKPSFSHTNLTWQQVENIIKILNNPKAIQDIIEIFNDQNDLDLAKITIQNKPIEKPEATKEYPIKLFLKSLKTVFENELKEAQKDSNYTATDYVLANLLDNLLSNAKNNAKLLRSARDAVSTAENEIKNSERAIKKAEASLKTAEENLALDQLKNSLIALKAKLTFLAQALNQLQTPGAPQPTAVPLAGNQENIAADEAQIAEAKKTIREKTSKLEAAQKKVAAAKLALKETQKLVEEIEYTTPTPKKPIRM